MARPRTDGLLYFPFDVDFFSDIKIKTLRAHYGTDGIALYIYLLCEIYRSGYYIKADEDFLDCAAADLGLSIEKTRQITTYLCRRSLFDDTLFTSVTVLTAKSIQRRYQEARKGCKRDVFVDERLWLLDESETSGLIKVRPFSDLSGNNGGFSGKNGNNSGKNDTKVKESKVNKSKAEQCTPDGVTAAAAEMRNSLVEKYGEDNVRIYELKFESWKQRNGGKVRAEKYTAIAQWLIKDGAEKPQNVSSFSTDTVMQDIAERYRRAENG